MRTYKLYFSNGKSTLIKANDRENAWHVAWMYEDSYGIRNVSPPYHTIYIQFYHS